ncbi:hypothetical protein FRAHR75_30037 [Frankia sp. Hr75.2]|nr:hypothetical protein FRAHR75_30037 [Frankia sp. Hr75.2]
MVRPGGPQVAGGSGPLHPDRPGWLLYDAVVTRRASKVAAPSWDYCSVTTVRPPRSSGAGWGFRVLVT